MDPIITKFLGSALEPIFILLCVMVIAGVFKERGAMASVYGLLKERIKSKIALVALLSLIFGVVPITTRIGFTCGMLDAVQDKSKNNQKMGTIAYLASHHYYLWSPLEKSIIITCGVLGISYMSFMQVMLIPALIAMVFSIVYIFASVTEEEIYLTEAREVSKGNIIDIALLFVAICAAMFVSPVIAFGVYAGYLVLRYKAFDKAWIDWKILAITAVVVASGMVFDQFNKAAVGFLSDSAKTYGLIVAVFGAYILSFIMGSSAKFAAVTGMLTKVFGMHLLPLFYLVDYAGYLISPNHKCVAIGKLYFKTPVGMYFMPIVLLSLILIAYGAVVSLIL